MKRRRRRHPPIQGLVRKRRYPNNVYRVVVFIETDEGGDWVWEELRNALRSMDISRFVIDDMENVYTDEDER